MLVKPNTHHETNYTEFRMTLSESRSCSMWTKTVSFQIAQGRIEVVKGNITHSDTIKRQHSKNGVFLTGY